MILIFLNIVAPLNNYLVLARYKSQLLLLLLSDMGADMAYHREYEY